MVFTNKGDTEHPFIRARLDLTDTSVTFAATGFRFLLTCEKKRNPQDELVTALFDISRAHFHSPVRKKVAIRMQGDPSCPSGIAMLNRAIGRLRSRVLRQCDRCIGVFFLLK